MQKVRTCSFINGELLPGIPTYFVSAGAEAPIFNEAFDSVMMVNVLEHVLDAGKVLHQLWAALKPGGILIFNDRYVDKYPYEEQYQHRDIDNALHPIRIRKPFVDHLLSQFEVLLRDDSGTVEMKQRATARYAEVGTYFIGVKKFPAASGGSGITG